MLVIAEFLQTVGELEAEPTVLGVQDVQAPAS